MLFSEPVDDLAAFGSSTGKSQYEVIEEQQRIIDAAHQNLNPRSHSVRVKSSSLDSRRKPPSFDVPPHPCNSASFVTDADINPIVPGVNPVYEYKYNRSRGIKNKIVQKIYELRSLIFRGYYMAEVCL